jgi:hypothetical protein
MASGRLSWSTCAGSRWILKARPWPCAGSRTARRARTPSPAESCANCAGTKGKARNRPSSSYPSAGRRCRVSASRNGRAGCGSGRTQDRGACAHAAPRLRVQTRQGRRRHPGAASLSRAPQHPAHSPLYGARARSVQGFLAGLTYEASALPRTGLRSVKAVEAVLFEAQRSCEDFGLHSRMQRGR